MLKSGIAHLASQEDLEDVVSPGASLLELDPLMKHNSTSSIPDASAFKIDGQDDRSSATMHKADLALRASQKDLEEVISMHPDTSTEEQQPLMQRCGSSSGINESATEADSQDEWKDGFISMLDMLKKLLEKTKGIFRR
ncbi:uncharacterized protein LOC124170017 [Ischnura elegans]|uniref:uncharacterized protein LOC124170017 n=1 Tax=Ischnura elegans TaxID=197161 RepID=UPI001ED87DF6|nr:uncharacterized protein LOC124170017 [Ischnura elegans]